MTITSEIYLCKVPITPTNQLDFPTAQEQTNYFKSKVVATYKPCKFVERDGTIRIKGFIDNVANCNYGFYINTSNNVGRIFYFWIVSKKQISKNTVELTIAIDLFQTYFNEYTFRDCYIERETVADDTIGKHILPEELALGDYVSAKMQKVDELTGNYKYMLAVTESGSGGIFGATYEGYAVYCFNADSSGVDALNSKIAQISDEGKADSIAFIFVYPSEMLPDGVADGERITEQLNFVRKEIAFEADNITTFKGSNESYTPYNNKLMCYPYTFITVTNGEGSNIVLKRELNNNASNTFTFILDGVLSKNPIFTLTPKSYTTHGNKYVDSISCGGFGLCSWNNDNYANWFAQHQNTIRSQSENATASYKASNTVAGNNYNNALYNNDIGTAKGVMSTIGNALGIFSVNALGAIGNTAESGVNTLLDYNKGVANANNDLANTSLLNKTNYSNTIRSLMASVEDAKVQPNTCNGDTSGCGLDLARGTNTFYIEEMTITAQYAKAIDMFFQMFGYKVNRIGKPDLRSRKKWNYIQTVGCNVRGDNIPTEDLDAINQMFDNGLTVWHNEADMFVYNTPNEKAN